MHNESVDLNRKLSIFSKSPDRKKSASLTDVRFDAKNVNGLFEVVFKKGNELLRRTELNNK